MAELSQQTFSPDKINYYESEDRSDFLHLLSQNPGVIIIKMSAEWCKPCKLIAPTVERHFLKTPQNILCINMIVDENIDLFAYFKRIKVAKGIPILLAYYKDNQTYRPDHTISGTNVEEINHFFATCIQQSNEYNTI